MDWYGLAKDGGGWVVTAGAVALFLRLLMRGEIVLGREYERVVEELDRLTARWEASAEAQAAAAKQQISALTTQVTSLSQKIAGEKEAE